MADTYTIVVDRRWEYDGSTWTYEVWLRAEKVWEGTANFKWSAKRAARASAWLHASGHNQAEYDAEEAKALSDREVFRYAPKKD